jgi:hypothetical protein
MCATTHTVDRQERSAVWADPAVDKMDRKVSRKADGALCKDREQIIAPIFGRIKHARGIRGFMRRARDAADVAWKLIAGIHNVLKLYRRVLAAPSIAPIQSLGQRSRRLNPDARPRAKQAFSAPTGPIAADPPSDLPPSRTLQRSLQRAHRSRPNPAVVSLCERTDARYRHRGGEDSALTRGPQPHLTFVR